MIDRVNVLDLRGYEVVYDLDVVDEQFAAVVEGGRREAVVAFGTFETAHQVDVEVKARRVALVKKRPLLVLEGGELVDLEGIEIVRGVTDVASGIEDTLVATTDRLLLVNECGVVDEIGSRWGPIEAIARDPVSSGWLVAAAGCVYVVTSFEDPPALLAECDFEIVKVRRSDRALFVLDRDFVVCRVDASATTRVVRLKDNGWYWSDYDADRRGVVFEYAHELRAVD